MKTRIVFDLEGTLSDSRHRWTYKQHRNWEAWNYLFRFDNVNESICDLYRCTYHVNKDNPNVEVGILTAKEARYRLDVQNWLDNHQIPYDFVHMKFTGLKLASPVFKLDTIMLWRGNGITTSMVYDDRADVVDHLLNNGIPAMLVGHQYDGE